tara:strand:+ start:4441 stop:5844 length:1404 start_codon:yes stop_codon:yes gene_type:complete
LVLRVKNKLKIQSAIFRAYDIRGEYPSQINKDVFFLLGQVIGAKVNNAGTGLICVCMDGRLSSNELKNSLIEGLLSTGNDVIDIGMLPTPLLYFALHHLKIANGLMITGSHNPKNYNGIKIVLNNKTLFGDDIFELYTDINKDIVIKNIQKGILKKENNILDSYIKSVKAHIKIISNLKIIIDCGNGVTGKVIKEIFNNLNIEIEVINEKVDGEFPNHSPDPTNINNLNQLKKKMKECNADIGLAYDGDGDRIIVIDKYLNIIWPDQLLMIFSKNILENKPGNKIVYDVKCSKHLENIIIENKGTPILSRTGHSFIKESIIKNNAILGGEMSGHIFFNDKWFGFDDGIYASLRFLEICSSYDELQSVINDLPKSITTPEINIKFEGNNHFTFMDLFVKLTKFEGAEIVNIDGMKIIYSFGWGLIRCSNTSSNLVLRFEADDEKSLNKIKTIMKNAMLKIDKNLDIPF